MKAILPPFQLPISTTSATVRILEVKGGFEAYTQLRFCIKATIEVLNRNIIPSKEKWVSYPNKVCITSKVFQIITSNESLICFLAAIMVRKVLNNKVAIIVSQIMTSV